MKEHELTRNEVAGSLRLSVRTLERWAKQGIGPRPIKRGPRLIRYSAAEVEEYRRSGDLGSTS